jgi:hypothetical protein
MRRGEVVRLPYAGVIQFRFKGFFSALLGKAPLAIGECAT